MTELKLYVWEDVLCDYTCGIAFAIAENIDDALEQIYKTWGYESEWIKNELKFITPKIHELTEKVGYAISGGG